MILLYYNEYIEKVVIFITYLGGMFMDIMSLSGIPSISNVPSDVQVAVLSKSLDTYQATGENLTKMMEASVTPELGQNIDLRI